MERPMHGWDERYADMTACYGRRWLEWTHGLSEAETAELAEGMRGTLTYAWWRLGDALAAYGAAWAEMTGVARLWAWVKRRMD